MSKIVSIHSYRGGTGKSNTSASLAILLAMEGLRVGVVDTDIQSPGIHVLFGLDEKEINYSLNDYLWGNCKIKQCAHDVSSKLGVALNGGQIFLIPSSTKTGEIVRVLREGYDAGILNDGFQDLVESMSLDVLMIDTHPGLNEETLLSIAISDILLLILRPDQQDYLGTSITIEIARKLDVPEMYLIVNKVPERFDMNEVRQRVEQTYNCRVAAMIHHSDEMMTLGSASIFALRYPTDPVTDQFRNIVRLIIGD
jgi:septum site-determining protein MinD